MSISSGDRLALGYGVQHVVETPGVDVNLRNGLQGRKKTNQWDDQE